MVVALYDASNLTLIDWRNTVAMDANFMNADGTVKDGGRDGSLFLQDSTGNPIKPAFFIDARYGYAQCSISIDKTLITNHVVLQYAVSASGTPTDGSIAHVHTNAPITRGQVLT